NPATRKPTPPASLAAWRWDSASEAELHGRRAHTGTAANTEWGITDAIQTGDALFGGEPRDEPAPLRPRRRAGRRRAGAGERGGAGIARRHAARARGEAYSGRDVLQQRRTVAAR